VLISGCSLVKVNPERAAGQVVATVNGVEIAQGQIDQRLEGFKNYYTSIDSNFFKSTEGKEILKNYEKQVLDALIDYELANQKAAELNISVSQEEVDARYDEIYQVHGERLLQYLEEEGMTVEEFKAELKREMIVSKVMDHFTSDVTVSRDEAIKYYVENADEFKTIPDMVKASHILVPTKEEAEEILRKYKEGADFADLAVEFSLDTISAQNGGDLGYFGKGDMVEPFEDVAFSMEPGDVSQPVQTRFGFHIIKLEDKMEGELLDFEDIKDYLIDYLTKDKKEARFTELLKEWREQGNVKIFLK
jgi:parvulin-like peptidyl-prolyl isomerase